MMLKIRGGTVPIYNSRGLILKRRISCILKIAQLSFAVLVAGCVTTSNLSPGDAVRVTPGESVVVIGVKKNYRIGIQKGNVEGESWKYDQMSVLASNTFPDQGYIVQRLTPRAKGENYAIAQILPEGIGGFTPRFSPCNGQDVLTFEAPAGKVIYVGDVDYLRTGDLMSFAYSRDINSAKSHIEKNFPNLASKLEQTDAKIMQVSNMNCGPISITIPIIIKR